MSKENINQKFRLENIDVTRNYFVYEIEHNALMRKKYKKYCTTLNYIEHLLTLLFPFTGGFCFFTWYSYRNYEFCNRIKNLNNCWN